MKPINFDGVTRIMGESQKEFLNLPIQDFKDEQGNHFMVSVWTPDEAELQHIKSCIANNIPIKIGLSVLGNQHPPVILMVNTEAIN